MARPSMYTDALGNRIVAMVQGCVPKSTAARSAGVGRSTLYEWISKGEAGEEPYASFAAKLDAAEADAEAAMIATVHEASAKDARHAQWMLERRFAKRWASQAKIESKVEHSGEVKTKPDFGALTEAEQDQLRKLLGKTAEG